jgi:sirohydrochlorin cobaltochelatase
MMKTRKENSPDNRGLSPICPICLAAFGTATKARASYEYLEGQIRAHFPGHEIFWAWSSRMITDKLNNQQDISVSSPSGILSDLHQRQYPWAVVQSIHLLGGHEFDRLTHDIEKSPIRTSVGLPLLSSPEDYLALCTALAPMIDARPTQAILLIGHGTDHPAWCAYPALQSFMRRQFGSRIFVGVIEGYPSSPEVIADIAAAGYTSACIIPLLLVAGMHFHRDLTGKDTNSWMTQLNQAAMSVEIIQQGLLILPTVSAMFCRHIYDAMAVIPENMA